MQGIGGIQLVSINGKKTRGTRKALAPGLNTVRVRFRWPQGPVQEVDLRFHATSGTVYFINYDVDPPHTESTNGIANRMVETLYRSNDPYVALGAVIVAPPAAAIGIGEHLAHDAIQQGKHATRVDLAVVAHHSAQGVVRQVRAYPDGRVDEKPWAAWAQMREP